MSQSPDKVSSDYDYFLDGLIIRLSNLRRFRWCYHPTTFLREGAASRVVILESYRKVNELSPLSTTLLLSKKYIGRGNGRCWLDLTSDIVMQGPIQLCMHVELHHRQLGSTSVNRNGYFTTVEHRRVTKRVCI